MDLVGGVHRERGEKGLLNDFHRGFLTVSIVLILAIGTIGSLAVFAVAP